MKCFVFFAVFLALGGCTEVDEIPIERLERKVDRLTDIVGKVAERQNQVVAKVATMEHNLKTMASSMIAHDKKIDGKLIGSVGQVMEEIQKLSFFMFPKLTFIGNGMEGSKEATV